MVKYKYNSVTYEVPTKPIDVSLGQYLDIVELNDLDIIPIMSKLLNADMSAINNSTDIEFQSLLLAQTNWIGDFIKDCTKPVKHKVITWEGKKYKLPNTFGEMNLGQRVMISQVSAQHEEGAISYKDFIATCVSIFIAPSIYKDQWSDEIDLMKDIILSHEALATMQTACFFLHKQKIMSSFGIVRLCFQAIMTRAKRKLKGLTGSD